jgi:hypothetical protein
MMRLTQVQRTRRLRENHNKKGFKQVSVWVPLARVGQLKNLAKQWRTDETKKASEDA